MTKLKTIQQDNDWVEGTTFSFGSKRSAKEKTKESRSARRESMIVNQTTRMLPKNGKKSLAVNGFDLMKNSLISSPISHRTRRKSMAVLPNRPVSEWETISPKTKLKKPSLSHKVLADEKSKKVDRDPIIIKKIASKSSLYASLSHAKLPRSGNTVAKQNEDIKEAEQMRNGSNRSSAVKIIGNAGSTHLSLKKLDGKQKSSVMVKKPVKRLTSKAATPLKSPINNNRRLTRSAKKKVKIVAESPIFSSGNFKKTPVRLGEKKQTPVWKSISNSSMASQDYSIDVPKAVSVASQKYNAATPFTPKPDEPLKLIRQNMKKKIADDIKSAKEFVDPSFLVIKKTPHKYVETKAVMLPSTPVSSSNLPPTPVSSRKSVLRSVRKRDSVRVEAKMSSEFGDCQMTSSILLEKPWSSTPMRKRTDETESPYPESNLINISELTHNSRDTDISDSFSESVVNANSNDVDELTPGVQLETGKRSFCSLM